MADDNILRVGAEFDVSNIISGAQAASTAFEGMGAKIAATSTSVAAASTGIDKLAASLKTQGLSSAEVSSALTNQGFSTKEVAAATATFDTETAAVTGQTKSLTASLDALTAALNRTGAASSTARTGMSGFGAAMGAARAEAGVLEGSTGMIAGGLARMAAQSATLAPLIQTLFIPFLAIAFIEILSQVGEEMSKLADATQKAADADANFDREMIKSVEALDKAREKAAELAGGPLAQAREEMQHAGDATLNLSSDVKALNERVADGPSLWKSFTEAVGTGAVDAWHAFDDAGQSAERDLSIFNRRVMDSVQQQKDLAPAIAEVQTKIRQLNEEMSSVNLAAYSAAAQENFTRQIHLEQEFLDNLVRMKETQETSISNISTEAAQKTAERRVAIEEAAASAVRTTEEADLAFMEAATRRSYEDHKISLEQETRDLVSEENTRISIMRTNFAAQQTILGQKQRAEPSKDFTPEVTALNAERERAETEHQQRLDTIEAQGAAERFKIDQEAALHRIEVDRQIATAYDEQSEHKAEAAYHAATTVATIESTGVEYTRARVQAIRDQISAIQQEQAVLDKGVKAPGGELADPAMASKYAENVAKITTLSQQMETVVTETTEETTRRVRELQSQQLDTELSTMEEQTRVTEDATRRQDEAVKTSFEDRSISARRYLETVQANSSAEYEAQISSITREIQLVTQAGDARVLTEEQVAKRLEELWKQEQQAHDRMLQQDQQAVDLAAKREQASIQKLAQQWGQDWTRMANEVLQGREKIGLALDQMAGKMELELIDKGIQNVVTKTAQWLLTDLGNWTKAITQKIAIQQTGAAAGLATQTATQKASAITDAKQAAQGAYAAVSSIPIVGPILAPEAAAIAFAAVLAFEKGGIVPETGPAMVHEKEMVLPAHISTAVQGAVPAMANFNEAMAGGFGAAVSNISNTSTSSSESKSVRTGPIRVTNNFPSTGNMTPDDVIAHVNRGIRNGLIKVGL